VTSGRKHALFGFSQNLFKMEKISTPSACEVLALIRIKGMDLGLCSIVSHEYRGREYAFTFHFEHLQNHTEN
jgi:hypothetical protein